MLETKFGESRHSKGAVTFCTPVKLVSWDPHPILPHHRLLGCRWRLPLGVVVASGGWRLGVLLNTHRGPHCHPILVSP